jgi:hypothetical protein
MSKKRKLGSPFWERGSKEGVRRGGGQWGERRGGRASGAGDRREAPAGSA